MAQVKIDPARFDRIARELGVKPEQTFTITEFLKPGIDEFCSILPPWLARPHSWFGGTSSHIRQACTGAWRSIPRRFPAICVSCMLAALRGFRSQNLRFQEEQHESRHGLISSRAPRRISRRACHRDRRMRAPHQRLWRHPQARQRQLPPDRGACDRARAGGQHALAVQAIDAVVSARTAALLDPDGEALTKCLADLAAPPAHAIAAE